MLESKTLLRLLLPLVVLQMKLLSPPLGSKQQHLMLNKKLPIQLHMKRKIGLLRPLYPSGEVISA